MKVYCENFVSVGWMTGKVYSDELMGTFLAKETFLIENGRSARPAGEPALILGDVNLERDNKQILQYASDFAPWKPRGEIFIVGTACAPGGKTVRGIPVCAKVGGFQKKLEVLGDRTWKMGFLGRRPGEPQPIAKLPLSYENSWGGVGYSKNPVGRGRDTKQMHNIERPQAWVRGRGDNLYPAGFGPLGNSWEPRKNKVGTYKGNWKKERWPWFPEDFDWGYFNAAPADQQIEGYLRGDEELEFENLHPKHAIYKSRLPGLRTRCFLNERLQNGELFFREVKMNLDTLWINMDEEKIILVWRGLAPVRTLKLREIEHVFVTTEPLSEPPRSLENYHEELIHCLNQGKEVKMPDAETAARAAFEKQFADMNQQFALMEQEMAKMEGEANQAFEAQKAQLIAQRMDPKLLEEPAQPQTLAEAKVQYQAFMDELKQSNPEQAGQMGEMDFGEFEQMEREAAQTEAEMAAAFPPPPTRESVQASLAESEPGGPKNFSNHKLSGLDLSGMDFAGADFTGADLSKAKFIKTNFAGANLSGANLSGADLTGADLTGATLNEADLSNAVLANAKLTQMAVAGANFSKLNLEGADFSGCHGKGANFSEAGLAGARFIGTKLPQANFSASKLEQADFNLAEVPAAQFDGAEAKGVQMQNADISGIHGGEKADFSGGNFRGAKGEKSIWEKSNLDGADFSKARLTRANFNEASLKESRFDRAEAAKASFDDANLQRAVLTNANFLRATFDRADLTQAFLMDSNLYGAGFWETIFLHTVIEGANVKATLIAK